MDNIRIFLLDSQILYNMASINVYISNHEQTRASDF